MGGGVTVILTLMILLAAIAGGVALFGAGGYVQRRHTVADNDERRDVLAGRRGSADAEEQR